MRCLVLPGVLLLFSQLPLFAQPLRGLQGYVFGAPGAASGIGDTVGTLQVGGGAEKVFDMGLGAGAELSALIPWRNGRETVGLFSASASYHFARDRQVFDPYIIGGYTLLFRSGSANLGNFGGGVNYWFRENTAFRVEIRDHVHSPAGFTIHYWGVRLGLAFR
jgi:hypothetical protein